MTQEDRLTSPRIEELWRDQQALTEYLSSRAEGTLSGRVDEVFTKTLIIAAASFFETELTDMIVALFRRPLEDFDELVEFVKNFAMRRRYFQLFDWGTEGRPAPNANHFYRLFGNDFTAFMQRRIQEDDGLANSISAFLEIGNMRNYIVHNDYADVTINRTGKEVYNLYTDAMKFLYEFPQAVRDFEAEINMTD